MTNRHWPRSIDYNEAVQNPDECFEDAELRAARPVTNPLGLPIPHAGGFADVYQLRSADGARSWAVKCFTKQVLNLQYRYQVISAHLEAASLPFMVPFVYLERGIRVHGEWYPVLKMHWVEGQTLSQFVGRHFSRPALKKLAAMWLKLAQQLRARGVTHADLQHGNVLLVPGQAEGQLSLKLVDYDGMFLPQLAGLESGEKGLPGYQHPQRLATGYYGPEVDNFSHLAIYTALRALLVKGRELWKTRGEDENLLFKEADFTRPDKSLTLRWLWRRGREDVRTLVGQLVLAASGPLDQVPELDAILDGDSVQPLTADQVRDVDQVLKIPPARGGEEGKDRPPPPVDPPSPPPPVGKPNKVKAVFGGLVGLGAAFMIVCIWVAVLQEKPKETAQKGAVVHYPAPAEKDAGVSEPTRKGAGNNKEQLLPPKTYSGGVKTLQGHTRPLHCLTFSNDGRWLASTGENSYCIIWDAATGKVKHKLDRHLSDVFRAAFSPDGKWIATGGRDMSVRIWDVATGTQRIFREGHGDYVKCVAFSPDTRWLVSASHRDAKINLWSPQTGALLRSFTAGPLAINALAVSPDAKWLAVGCSNGTVLVLNSETGAITATLRGHEGPVLAVAVSPDARWVASGSTDGMVRIWDPEGGEKRILYGHGRKVIDVVFGGDAQWLFTASSEGFLCLRNPTTGGDLSKPKWQGNPTRAVAVSPDGKRFASAGADGEVKLWESPPPVDLPSWEKVFPEQRNQDDPRTK